MNKEYNVENYIPEIRYIIHRKCTPTWKMNENTLEGMNLTYIVHGEANYTVDNRMVNVAQGNLMVLPKGCVRKAITCPDRPMQCFSVDFIMKNTQNQELPPPFPFLSEPGHHEDIIHLFHELSFTWLDKQPSYAIKCNGLFLLILHRFMELVIHKADSYAGDSRINKVIRHIATHYSEHITAREMAELVHLNPTYFGLLFRQTMGVSFNQYLIQIRIRNAENMLSSGEYTVGNVAEACGFTDMSHFYKQFKLIKGFPPSHSLPKKF